MECHVGTRLALTGKLVRSKTRILARPRMAVRVFGGFMSQQIIPLECAASNSNSGQFSAATIIYISEFVALIEMPVGPKYSTDLRKRVSTAVSKRCGGRFSMMELRHARLHPLRPTFSICDGPSQSRVVAPERILGVGKPHSEGTPPDSFAAVGCGEVDTGGDR